MEQNGAQLDISGYSESVTVLRSLAQWVMLHGKDCGGARFPFSLPHVKLVERCSVALATLSGLVGRGLLNERAAKHAARLRQILQSVAESPEIRREVRELREMEVEFAQLRKVLRLEGTDVHKQEKDKERPDCLEAVSKLKEEVESYCGILCERQKAGAATIAQQYAIDMILAYFDQYRAYLFGHFAVTYDDSGNTVIKLIERSNNIMEWTYRDQKHHIRRRTGTKNLGYAFERLFPAAGMIANLDNPAYQRTVLYGKTRSGLAELFAPLDTAMDYGDTPMCQDDCEEIGGRLPKADRRIVCKPSFSAVVYTIAEEFTNAMLQVEQ